MHKIKFQGKFFKSLNFRIMLFLLLMGTVPALIIGGVFLMSYERQAMAQLSNDVKISVRSCPPSSGTERIC